ncbi:hypothetical protein F511_40390 [Dorcoceras hygrometricum]|uniref:Uncharacterized protein n=1 Tax=Dorcoceras hygrometricum TaxID=472368 RepID=A0A2Z7BIH2_9LAMI|nr:hypothetical protein F511_40390 [Dorcoceras hygrometricum]
MPPRRRGRATRQIPTVSEGQNEEGERSLPVRRRLGQVYDEVDVLAARVDEMELIMARFQRMNPQTFDGDESSSDAESWLQHITGLFDRLNLHSVQLGYLKILQVDNTYPNNTKQENKYELFTQSQHILPTQLLIKFHQLQATVPLTRADIWNALQLIPCVSATAEFSRKTTPLIVRTDKQLNRAAKENFKNLRCYYEVEHLGFLTLTRAPETDLFGLQCPTSPLLPPRKVPLEDLIYTSCTDPIPQPAAARTPRLNQPSAVTHLFYAYVRKATNTEFNVVVVGRLHLQLPILSLLRLDSIWLISLSLVYC